MPLKEIISKYKFLIFGLLGAVVITALVMLLMAVFMYATNADSKMVSTLSALSLAIGCFFGALFASKIKKSGGLLTGIAVSGVLFAIIFILSLFFGDNAFSVSSLLHAVIMLLSGGIGGILGVNGKQKSLI